MGNNQPMTAERLSEIVQEAGFESQTYSGRGMYGKECVGYTVDNGDELFSAVMIATSCEDEEKDHICNLFRNGVKQDRMGRDQTIIYFPRVKYQEHATADELPAPTG